MVEKERKAKLLGVEEEVKKAERKREEQKIEAKRRGKMMGLVARLARRPWKESERETWAETAAAKEVATMNHRRIRKLIAVVETTMSSTPRSIAMASVRLILKGRLDVQFVSSKVASVMMGEKSMKKATMNALRRWGSRWERIAGVLVVHRVTAVPKASRSILDILDSSNEWSRKPIEECKCCCNDEELTKTVSGKTMRKWKGHVLESLHDFLNNNGVEVPKNWNVRAKCAPDPVEEETKLENIFEKMHREMIKKTKWEGKTISLPSVRGRALRDAVAEMHNMERKIPAVRTIKEVKQCVKHFAVCPVDK